MEEKALPFLAVGRVRDQTIMATFCEMIRGQAQTEDIFKRLLEASKAKLAPGQRQRLQWGNGSVCCLLDMQGESLYCLITAQMEYPERLAYQLLQELNQHAYHNHGAELLTAEAYSLNKALQPFMENLIRKYEDPKSFDRISTLLAKTNTVKTVMQDSVRKVVETGESLQELEAKAGRMSEQSRAFASTSREVRRHFWFKNKKLCFAGVLALVIIAIILGVTLHSPSSSQDPNNPKSRSQLAAAHLAATNQPPRQAPVVSTLPIVATGLGGSPVPAAMDTVQTQQQNAILTSQPSQSVFMVLPTQLESAQEDLKRRQQQATWQWRQQQELYLKELAAQAQQQTLEQGQQLTRQQFLQHQLIQLQPANQETQQAFLTVPEVQNDGQPMPIVS